MPKKSPKASRKRSKAKKASDLPSRRASKVRGGITATTLHGHYDGSQLLSSGLAANKTLG